MGFLSTPTNPGQPDPAQDKASLCQQHIEGWETSGLTQGIYCQQHAISLASFGYWRTRLKRMQPDKNGREIGHLLAVIHLMRQKRVKQHAKLISYWG